MAEPDADRARRGRARRGGRREGRKFRRGGHGARIARSGIKWIVAAALVREFRPESFGAADARREFRPPRARIGHHRPCPKSVALTALRQYLRPSGAQWPKLRLHDVNRIDQVGPGGSTRRPQSRVTADQIIAPPRRREAADASGASTRQIAAGPANKSASTIVLLATAPIGARRAQKRRSFDAPISTRMREGRPSRPVIRTRNARRCEGS